MPRARQGGSGQRRLHRGRRRSTSSCPAARSRRRSRHCGSRARGFAPLPRAMQSRRAPRAERSRAPGDRESTTALRPCSARRAGRGIPVRHWERNAAPGRSPARVARLESLPPIDTVAPNTNPISLRNSDARQLGAVLAARCGPSTGSFQAGLVVVIPERLPFGMIGVEQRSPACPFSTAASFHARFCASCTPVLRPKPPVGGISCAASPARNNAPVTVTVGDDRRRLPGADAENLHRQIGLADALADQLAAAFRARNRRGVAVLLEAVDQEAPAVVRVYRQEGARADPAARRNRAPPAGRAPSAVRSARNRMLTLS